MTGAKRRSEIRHLPADIGEHRCSFCAGPGHGAREQRSGARRPYEFVLFRESSNGSVGS